MHRKYPGASSSREKEEIPDGKKIPAQKNQEIHPGIRGTFPRIAPVKASSSSRYALFGSPMRCSGGGEGGASNIFI
jgi:hypothetical protein